MTPLTRQAIIAGILGNALEWYDFALYGHFSVFIGKTFFPGDTSGLAMLAAFAVFSVSFFMRPIGAVIFSVIGDRQGRKKALSLSMLGMAIPTAGIGLLPPFSEIGYTATVILIVLRLFQGLSLGGEMGGAVTYVMEHTPKQRIGLASSLIQASTCLGLLLGTLISTGISSLLSEAEFNTWGWRIPFILGLIAAWTGLRIRRDMPESLLYEMARSEDRLLHNPLSSLFRHNKRAVLLGVALVAPMTACFFLAFVYFNSFMMSDLQLPARLALMMTSVALIMSLAATLLGGCMADRWGYKVVLALGSGLLLVTLYPITASLSGGLGTGWFWAGFFGFACLTGLYTSSVFGAVAGLFSTEIRYSGVSFAVNIASPLFGSTVPLLAAWLIRDRGAVDGFLLMGSYLAGLFILAGWAIYRMKTAAFTGWGQAS